MQFLPIGPKHLVAYLQVDDNSCMGELPDENPYVWMRKDRRRFGVVLLDALLKPVAYAFYTLMPGIEAHINRINALGPGWFTMLLKHLEESYTIHCVNVESTQTLALDELRSLNYVVGRIFRHPRNINRTNYSFHPRKHRSPTV